jgi:hypothetical protein
VTAIRHLSEILKIEVLCELPRAQQPIFILETGTIRGDGESSQVGDGWSTMEFAMAVAAHHAAAKDLDVDARGYVRSIDLEIDTAAKVLQRSGLAEYVELVQDHSIAALAHEVRKGLTYDVVFLDSDNDPQLILHEFMIARHLVRSDGFIVIDDCRMPHHTEGEPSKARKGELVLHHLDKLGWRYTMHERQGWGSYRTGVVVIPGGQ